MHAESSTSGRRDPVGFASSVNVTTAPASSISPTRKSSTTSVLRFFLRTTSSERGTGSSSGEHESSARYVLTGNATEAAGAVGSRYAHDFAMRSGALAACRASSARSGDT